MIKISVLVSLYKCEKYLERFFLSVLEIDNLNETEFVFIHNDPAGNEENIINSFIKNHPDFIHQYIVVPREGLYKSWNRGIQVSKGEYIAVWNVDDIRMPGSLKLQAEALEKHKEIDMVYGDRYIINHINDDNIRLEITKDINQSSWNHSFQDGAFLMWRKSVYDDIGYFDEQFVMGGDCEFWLRLTESHKILKINAPMGIYLREKGEGISKTIQTGNYEKIILGLRYGFYPRWVIHPFGWRKAVKMINPGQIMYSGQTRKRNILKYHSLMIYFMSAFYLIFLAIPLYLLSGVMDLTQFNYHYFKNLIIKN
jgi:glycosyltransferase involved in cell wall biosynthesis